MNEINSKPWYESLSIWGNVLTAVATVLAFFNIIIPQDTAATAASAVTQIATAWSTKDYGGILTGLIALFGVVMSVTGRTQAVQPVHLFTPFTVAPEGVKPATKSA